MDLQTRARFGNKKEMFMRIRNKHNNSRVKCISQGWPNKRLLDSDGSGRMFACNWHVRKYSITITRYYGEGKEGLQVTSCLICFSLKKSKLRIFCSLSQYEDFGIKQCSAWASGELPSEQRLVALCEGRNESLSEEHFPDTRRESQTVETKASQKKNGRKEGKNGADWKRSTDRFCFYLVQNS